MKDVYEKTPQMGDPASLEPQIAETLSNIERLKLEVQKYEVRSGSGTGVESWLRLPACLAAWLPACGEGAEQERWGPGRQLFLMRSLGVHG